MGSADYIGGFGLGIMWTNVACLSFLIGMTSALETLCSQAFGKRDFKLLGSIHNKAQMIMLVVAIPLSFFMYYCDNILIVLGMQKELALLAAQFTRIYIPSCFIMGEFETTKKYLQTQQIFYPPLVINVVTALLHPLWCILFMNVFTNKLSAIAYAKNFTNLLSYTSLLLYITLSKCCKESWTFPKKESFKDWGPFIKLAVYGAAFTCLEWWACEIINIFAGYIESTSLAASIAISNLNILYCMIPFGIGMTATTLIGNSLGELSSFNAKTYAKAAGIINAIIVFIMGALMIIFSKGIASFFTEDREVASIIIKILPLLALEEMFDTTQTILGKVIIGMGKQEMSSKIALVVYYAIMLPLAYIMGLKLKLGAFGLWEAMAIGMAILTVCYFMVIYRSDWEKLVQEVIEYLEIIQKKSKIDNECSQESIKDIN